MESKSLNFCNQYQKCEGIPVMREVAYAKNDLSFQKGVLLQKRAESKCGTFFW